MPPIHTALIDSLRAVVGDRGLLTDPSDIAAYTEDWRRLYQGRTPAVVRPATTEEMAAVARSRSEWFSDRAIDLGSVGLHAVRQRQQVRSRHAYDGVGPIVQPDRAADHVRAGLKPGAPEFVREHDNIVAAVAVLFG